MPSVQNPIQFPTNRNCRTSWLPDSGVAMVKSTEENSPPLVPFLKKCYEMVEDEATDPIISWGSNGDTFVIWDMTQFTVQLLPKYFKHSNFSSFMRQLNIYGFRKVDTDRWEFANDGFIKGQKHLLKNIYRRKNLQATTDQKKSPPPPDNAARQVDKTNKNDSTLLKQVENLKNDKNALMKEFIKLRQLQETSENNLVVLRERLQGMETNQQQMLSFLVMAMQNPGVLFQLLQVKESTWRMAEMENILEGGEEEEEEAVVSEGTIVRYQPNNNNNNPLVPEISSASRLEKTAESDNQPPIDGGNDAFLSIEFLKRLMEEKFSLDSHGPVILPDLPDDGTWKELLLAYPFVEKTQEEKQDYLPSTESFDLLMKQMENSQDNDDDGDDENKGEFDSSSGENLDHLTVEMEHLAYGTNPALSPM